VRRRNVLGLLAALPALLVAAPPAGAAVDVVVSAASEPPDFEVAGGRFRHSYTVSNNGSTTAKAGSSRTTFFLSADPVRGSDIALRPSARTSSLIQKLIKFQQKTRRVTLNIPDSVPAGFYFLIGCADGNRKIREGNESNNCRISGQRVGINTSERGEPGPAGPAGAAGPPGRDLDRRRLPRTVLDLGTKTAEPEPTNPGDDEGSTSTAELAKIGPLSIRAVCRATTNGDNDEPGEPFGNIQSFDEDGDEAKILLYSDAGSFSFSGAHGPRSDVAAGEGTPDVEDQTGGEGHHMFVATMRDPDPNTTRGGQHNGVFERAWAFGFKSVTGWVSHSNGMELIISAYAGIDVLDVGDRCVFSGTVTVVNPGA
jgi:hypothetical protein